MSVSKHAELERHRRANGRRIGLELVRKGHTIGQEDWVAVAITPSAKKPGYWQLSYYGPDGFSGDHQCLSKRRALMRASREGFVDPCPGLLDGAIRETRFHTGNRAHKPKRRTHTQE